MRSLSFYEWVTEKTFTESFKVRFVSHRSPIFLTKSASYSTRATSPLPFRAFERARDNQLVLINPDHDPETLSAGKAPSSLVVNYAKYFK